MRVLTAAVGLLLLLGVALVGGDALWRGASATIVRALDRGGAPKRDLPIASDDVPPPVARYLAHAIPAGQRPIRTVRLIQEGSFFINNAWKPLRAEQIFTTSPPAFMWDARIAMAPFMSVYVRDAYLAGRASMRARVMAVYPIVNASNRPELNAGALMRYLGEAAWFPTRLMPGDGLSWQGVDDHQAIATLVDRDTRVSLRFTFDAAGDIREIYAADRFREVNGAYVPTPWRVRAEGHETFHGMRLMSPAVAEWVLPEGPLPYWRGRIGTIDYTY